ncbi:MAG TPA: cupin domain-containing protein [Thermomicrobiales bacterium]|nr:cupin domain-containing protein [Thermomicrobiales bacterium]
MEIIRGADLARERGGDDRFTGAVTLTRLAGQVSGANVAIVRFADGARTHWHEHAAEQILYVLEGECRVATATAAEARLQAGDLARLPARERHWHGAAPGTTMAHLSITSGAGPTWYEPAPTA